MAKLLYLLILAALICSCDTKESMQKHNEAQKQADYILNNLEQQAVLEKFPEKYFVRKDMEQIFSHLDQNCDWRNRDGKFVDFFTIGKIGHTDITGFIYEYYLKCDSVRVILVFDMNKKTPELQAFNIEPIENVNKYIVHPENQLQHRKE